MAFVMTYDKRNRDNLKKLGDKTRLVAEKWYEYLVKNEIDVLIYETIRTKEQQAEYVRKGASQTMTSYHLVGQALDFVPVGKGGTALWSGYGSADIKKAIAEAKRLGFTWGGDWTSFVDKPHLQYDKIGYGKDTFGKYDELVKKETEVAAKPKEEPDMKETGQGVATGDVWIHKVDTTTFSPSTRLKVLRKGEKVSIFGEGKYTYKIGKGMYVSKKYIVKIVAPKAKTGVTTGDVWLHSKADFTAGTRTLVAKKGTKLGVYGEMNGMYKVRYNGKTHYVSKKYVRV